MTNVISEYEFAKFYSQSQITLILALRSILDCWQALSSKLSVTNCHS